MIMTYILACSLGLITVGCSTFSKDPNKTVEIPANKLDNIPQWYLVKDPDDTKFIVVTATDISKDMQFAIDKATLNAKIQLAARLKSDIDSVEREIDRVSKVRVKQALGFFKRENIAVFKEGDSYRAYVQFKISTEDARRMTQPVGNAKSREDKFKELEDEQPPARSISVAPLDVDNEEYKQRREAALKKPGAVINQYTLR